MIAYCERAIALTEAQWNACVDWESTHNRNGTLTPLGEHLKVCTECKPVRKDVM